MNNVKIAINSCCGGFALSEGAKELYAELSGGEEVNYSNRCDPILIRVIEEFPGNSSAWFSDIKIIEIPGDVDWGIEDYDGNEWIAENHRTWR